MLNKLLLFLVICSKRQFKNESTLIIILDLRAFIEVILLISIFLTLVILEYKFLLGFWRQTIYDDDKILEVKNEMLLVSKMKYTLYLMLGIVCMKE